MSSNGSAPAPAPVLVAKPPIDVGVFIVAAGFLFLAYGFYLLRENKAVRELAKAALEAAGEPPAK